MDVSALTSATGQTGQAGPNRFSQLSSEEFLKVLFTELQNQDPLKPQDSSKMLEQLSSLRNIESQMSLQDQLEDLVNQNQVASAGNLIGKIVQGLDASNNSVTGLVTAVRVTDQGAMLQLDSGAQVAMSRVTAIAAGVNEPAQ